MNIVRHFIATAALAALATGAQALTVTSTDLKPFEGSSSALVQGVKFESVGGKFQSKTIHGTSGKVYGMGVSGKTGGEIDIGESIVASFLKGAQTIESFSLAFLFDGPEFNDVNERAEISFGGTTGTLIANGANHAVWSLADGTVQNIDLATVNGAGVWTVFNPFGDLQGDTLSFTAVKGFPSTSCRGCNNQSDYSFLSVTAVPEPSTYALMAGGLLAMASVVRRRSRSGGN